MKAGNAVQKVKGGKLVRVEATFDTHLSEVTITGDFFLYPEEALEEIENTLKGAPLPLEREKLVAQIEKVVADNHATLVGFSPVDLVTVLEEAVK